MGPPFEQSLCKCGDRSAYLYRHGYKRSQGGNRTRRNQRPSVGRALTKSMLQRSSGRFGRGIGTRARLASYTRLRPHDEPRGAASSRKATTSASLSAGTGGARPRRRRRRARATGATVRSVSTVASPRNQRRRPKLPHLGGHPPEGVYGAQPRFKLVPTDGTKCHHS